MKVFTKLILIDVNFNGSMFLKVYFIVSHILKKVDFNLAFLESRCFGSRKCVVMLVDFAGS